MAAGSDTYRRGKPPVLPGGESKYLEQEFRKLEQFQGQTLSAVSRLEKQVRGSEASIEEERNLRVSEQEAFAQQITTLEAQTRNNAAQIVEDRTVWASRTGSIASALVKLEAETVTELNSVKATITQERTARTTATESLAQQITTLNASFTQEVADRVSGETSLGTRITSAEAAISSEQSARASAVGAVASSVTSLTASFNQEVLDRVAGDNAVRNRVISAEAAIVAEQTARANADGALAQQITTLTTTVNGNTAAINNESTVRASALQAIATQLSSLTGQVASNTAAIETVTGITVSGDQSLASALTTLQATVNNTAGALATETSNRQAADSGLQNSLTTLTSRVQTEETARATADTALASQISTVSAQAFRQRVYRQGTAPSSPQVGDIWFDTSNNNLPRYWSGSAWADASDLRLPALEAAVSTESSARVSADSALASQITTVSAAVSRQRVYRQSSAPGAPQVGDLWFDTANANAPKYWNGTSWQDSADVRIPAVEVAISNEVTARASADSALGSQITTLQGQFDSNAAQVQQQLSVLTSADESLASQLSSVSASANRQRTYRQTVAPTSPSFGDVWYDTGANNVPKWWNGSAWVESSDARITPLGDRVGSLESRVGGLDTTVLNLDAAVTSANSARVSGDVALAQQITTVSAAASRARVFRQSTAPTSPQEGDLWYDTGDNNAPKIRSGSSWVSVVDPRIAELSATITTESQARVAADSAFAQQLTTVSATAGRQRVFAQGTQPTAGAVGDLWINTNDSNRPKFWDGAAWVDRADPRVASALTQAGAAQTQADTALSRANRQRVWSQATAPTAEGVGDLWINTAQNNRSQYWNGSAWVDRADTRIDLALQGAAQALADVQTETATRIASDNALAQQITTVTSSLNGATTSISTLSSSLNGVRGRFGVTINNNGNVTGISLLSDSSNGSPSSVFRVEADRFAIRNPGASSDSLYWDGGANRLVVRGDILATSLTANTVNTDNIFNGAVTNTYFSTGAYSTGVTVNLPAGSTAVAIATFRQGAGRQSVPVYLLVDGYVVAADAPGEGTTGAISYPIYIYTGSEVGVTHSISVDTAQIGDCYMTLTVIGAKR